MVGMGVGQDEQADLGRALCRLHHIVEDDILGGGHAAIDQADLIAVDQVDIDEPGYGSLGRRYDKGDLQGVDVGGDLHFCLSTAIVLARILKVDGQS